MNYRMMLVQTMMNIIKEFDLVKKILMIAQRKDLHTMEELASLLKMDMTDTILHYMDVAYNVLKNWQYDDVKYYETLFMLCYLTLQIYTINMQIVQ